MSLHITHYTEPSTKRGWIRLLFVSLFLCGAAASVRASDQLLVAAASSVNGALSEISQNFTKSTNSQIRISFGSSGNLTRQIIQGAPFEFFLSADGEFARTLLEKGLANDESVVYAVGRLVLFIPHGSSLDADSTLEDLATALADGRLKRLAMANPEHAPYGRAAREVLQHHNLWQQLQGKLLLGENVAQAAQFAGTGDVDAGLISASIALEPAMARRGTHVLLPERWHKPLEHHMVMLGSPGPVSRSFRAYVLSDESRGVLRKFGFSLPGQPR